MFMFVTSFLGFKTYIWKIYFWACRNISRPTEFVCQSIFIITWYILTEKIQKLQNFNALKLMITHCIK